MTTLRAWRLTGRGPADGPDPALVDVGLACCTLEFEAALAAFPEAVPVPVGELPPGTPRLVVISGTVTDRLAPAVQAVVEACAAVGPVTVAAFGACASSGGPYWDSYAVTNGIDQVVGVDVYLPGCPPPPDALVTVVEELLAEPRDAVREAS
ncbi:NADH-quinone oxidoreductase subunit B [Friedmanniella endophytica]|uniref:NADH-quinone oxidoreductase subunit B n=1 Tax=Microlunatus kandeliicorticis TaxID=1759536 RepID=A0A7W3IPG2_9ACTN|nr:hypothetical protein [Microlunatus kandeliicorticis]MBA8792820.1 NADH-quinone oxidoreductase subunit B [Microlunatus kandeliicorticis]